MPSTFYGWLSAEPPVLYHAACPGGDLDLGVHLPESRVFRLAILLWDASADAVARDYGRARRNRPRHVLHYLVPDVTLVRELAARGVPASLGGHNALLDERVFRPQPDVPKEFDAVHNARIAAFKRHGLAAGVAAAGRLLVVGGVSVSGDSAEEFERLRRLMPAATFAHADDPGRFFPEAEVAGLLNRARVGLCLSAVEGEMYGCAESLLCGIPVVSTAARGGRLGWLDPRYSRVVRADPRAVAGAVRELAALGLDPAFVRQEALGTLLARRRRLVEVVQGWLDAERAGRDFGREFYARFRNKGGRWREPAAVAAALAEDVP